DNRVDRMASLGAQSMTPDQGLSALKRLLEGGSVHVGVIPLDVEQWMEFNPVAASSPMFARLVAARQGGADTSGASSSLLDQLAQADPAARTALLRDFVREEVSRVLRIPKNKLDSTAPLTGLGLDSLMGLELRQRMKRGANINVSTARLLRDM